MLGRSEDLGREVGYDLQCQKVQGHALWDQETPHT